MSGEGSQRTFGAKQELVLYNPFTIHNNNPKYPDGLASYSLGRKYQRTSEIRGREHILILFPGLMNWLLVYSELNIPTEAPDPQVFPQDPVLSMTHGVLENDNMLSYDVQKQVSSHPQGGATNYVFKESVDKISEWRIVSIGLRLYCANTDRQNEGWIEAIRLTRNQIKEFMGVALNDHASGYQDNFSGTIDTDTYKRFGDYVIGNGYLLFREEYMKRLFGRYETGQDIVTIANLPGYAVLPYKDVADYQFCLNPNKHTNEFQSIRAIALNDAYCVTNPYKKYQWNYTTGELDDTSANMGTNWLLKGMFPHTHFLGIDKDEISPLITSFEVPILGEDFSSENHDVIIMRLHLTDDARVAIHTCANYEYIVNNNQVDGVSVAYTDKSAVSRYVENRCQYHKRAFESKGRYPDTKY